MLTSSMTPEPAAVQGNGSGNHANGNGSDPASLLQSLTTESQNEASQGLDTKSVIEIARIINHEDAKVAGSS